MPMHYTNQNDSLVQHEILKMEDRYRFWRQRLPIQVLKWMRLSLKNLKEPVTWSSNLIEKYQTVEFSRLSILLYPVRDVKTCFFRKIRFSAFGFCANILPI